MKTLQDILIEIQALASVAENQFEANLATAVSDLQAFIASVPTLPSADPVVTIVTTTQSGVTETFIPQVASTTSTS